MNQPTFGRWIYAEDLVSGLIGPFIGNTPELAHGMAERHMAEVAQIYKDNDATGSFMTIITPMLMDMVVEQNPEIVINTPAEDLKMHRENFEADEDEYADATIIVNCQFHLSVPHSTPLVLDDAMKSLLLEVMKETAMNPNEVPPIVTALGWDSEDMLPI